MDFDFEELYQTVMLDHSRKPRNFGPLPEPTVTVTGDNPTCGDEIALSLKIDHDKIEDVGFTGSGCSICMASASMMTQKIKRKTRGEAEELWGQFQAMITGKTTNGEIPKALGDLRLLEGVRKFPQRVKCATLAWHALKEALATGAGKTSLSLGSADADL
jgi:nitrogen fixation NifU-like protein